MLFRSSTRGCSVCLRLNASSWCVSDAARSAACLISFAACPSRPSGLRSINKAAIALNNGEQIIKIVGHAGRQLPYRLHALGLLQPTLQLLLLGDVHQHAMKQLPPVGPFTSEPLSFTHSIRPSRLNMRYSARNEFPESVGFFSDPYNLNVFRMYVADPVGRIVQPFRWRVTQKFLDLRADEPPFRLQAKLCDISHRR